MFGKLTDMRLDAKDREEYVNPTPPVYPYGLSISLCNDELEKLGIDEDEEVCVGDMVHLKVMGKVTSHSLNESEGGSHRRIEIQITHLAIEDEDTEEAPKRTAKFYTKK